MNPVITNLYFSLTRDWNNLKDEELVMPSDTLLGRVNRLYYDYVASTNDAFIFARIKEDINKQGISNADIIDESFSNSTMTFFTGLQDLDENVSESDLKEMKVESIKRDFVERQANSTSGRLIGGSIRMACNEATELACQDGLMCYPINKKCDRWSDCIMDR